MKQTAASFEQLLYCNKHQRSDVARSTCMNYLFIFVKERSASANFN